MILAPIALFVYNRPWHTQQTVEALQKNELVESSELFVFSDGPKSEADKEKVLAIRKYIKTISGFKSINIIEREQNLGLAQSIITGVTEIINKYGRIIVLEDDMVTSPYFLKFMNEALEFYRNEERVVCIHGYMYPVKGELPETFFLKGADCWGWATWKRGWDLFESDGKKLLSEIKKRRLQKRFDINGACPYIKMIEDQIKGKNDSWAVRWYASAFLQDKLTLYPGRSQIFNFGLDASGTHCGVTIMYDIEVSKKRVSLKNIPIEENIVALKRIEKFLKSAKPSFARLIIKKVYKLLVGYRWRTELNKL